jgi:hypothetical protein
MIRAIQWLCFVSIVCVCTSPAFAFHVGKTFADAPGAGGGGGLYFVGSPRERGWTCTACHTEAPRDLKVRFSASLFTDFHYAPDGTTELTIRITNESRGLSAGLSNFNGMVLSVLDGAGNPAGTFTNATPDQYEIRSTSRGDLAIASAGQTTGVIEWRFSWVAPVAGTGSVTMYLAVVDGNGADSDPNITLTDPFGDDVYVAKVVLQEASPAAYGPTHTRLDRFFVGSVGPAWVARRSRRRRLAVLRMRCYLRAPCRAFATTRRI